MNYVDIYQAIDRGDRLGRLSAWLIRVLTEIGDGRSHVLAVRHPLGFICLPVERHGTDGVCVHFWDDRYATVTSTTSPIHAHSWELLSYVLFGEVQNVVIQVTDDQTDPTSRIFEVRSRGDVDELWATSRLVRETDRKKHVNPGGRSYALPAGVFHTTIVQPGMTAATIALGSSQVGSRDLSLGPIDGRSHQIRRLRCDQQETIKVARAVADRAMAGCAFGDGGR